ncbi:MAG: cysteine-rich CWC family protein [Phycisphaerae bacterium]
MAEKNNIPPVGTLKRCYCGREFICQNTGAKCWCSDLPLIPGLAKRGEVSDCYCRECLQMLIREMSNNNLKQQ